MAMEALMLVDLPEPLRWRCSTCPATCTVKLGLAKGWTRAFWPAGGAGQAQVVIRCPACSS